MESLSNKQDIGNSLAAAEVLWQQHESLEAKAQVTDRYNHIRIQPVNPSFNRTSMTI